jgi:2-polyprenyl-3-methyl-5-hydroxy-6-metoxy-1,4-benzoquinol methylase
MNVSLRDEIEKKGYCIINNIFSNNEIERYKNEIIKYINTKKNLYFDSGGISIPNFIEKNELNIVSQIKDDENINKCLNDIFKGDDYRFCSHNDIGINRIVGWHKDKLNGEVEKYETINIWTKHENQEHEIVKVLIYLEDHSNDNDGLKIVPGSHKKQNMETNGWIQLQPKIGDVIIFDQRITHRGMENQVSTPRILVSFGFGKNNIFTDNFEKGTIVRQNKQNNIANMNELKYIKNTNNSKIDINKIEYFWNNCNTTFSHLTINHNLGNYNKLTNFWENNFINKINFKEKKILDYGIGGAYLGKYLIENKEINMYYGVDISTRSLEKAKDTLKSYKNYKLFNCQEFYESFNKKIDIIICQACIQHFPDKDYLIKFLQKINTLNSKLIMLQITYNKSTIFNNSKYTTIDDVVRSCYTNDIFISLYLKNYRVKYKSEIAENDYQFLIFKKNDIYTKYCIPKDLNKPQWVINHFEYLNKKDNELSKENKECKSELTKICKKYEQFTDKGPTGPYYIKHNYTEIYGDLLRYYRNRQNNILEIGIRQGGSLKMWSEYFTNSNIYGIDINLKSIETNLDEFYIFEGDAYNKNTINKFFKNIKFDIIIDDGSHLVTDQIKCLNLYSKLLTNDGILIIEDIASIKDAKTIINNFDGRINKCSIIDRTHCIPSLDDINVIYYK